MSDDVLLRSAADSHVQDEERGRSACRVDGAVRSGIGVVAGIWNLFTFVADDPGEHDHVEFPVGVVGVEI